MSKKDIIDAWVRIRKIDQTIPDEVLDFMKDTAIKELEKIELADKIHLNEGGYWEIKRMQK